LAAFFEKIGEAGIGENMTPISRPKDEAALVD
jgi:hypothetical protein